MPISFGDLIAASSSEESFLQIFQNALSRLDQPSLEAHHTILAACYRNPGLAPTRTGDTPEELAQFWLRKYHDSFESGISRRISKPPGTIADPIANTIINARLTGLTTEHLEQIKYAHKLSMSAENVLGLLLEEFLAVQLADYGRYCCWGE